MRYWIETAERAVKTAAQSVLAAWAVGDGLANAFELDWKLGAGVAAGGAVMSLLTSIASAGFGPSGSPSLVHNEPPFVEP